MHDAVRAREQRLVRDGLEDVGFRPFDGGGPKGRGRGGCHG